MDAKYNRLTGLLRDYSSFIIAFSGGVDSTFLLKVAHGLLGDRVLALTASSASVPPGELEGAKQFVAELGCRHLIVDSHELANPSYASNPANRCFFCKDELYRICRNEGDRLGIKYILDGTNLDDLNDYRPGLKAADQWHVRHPLVDAEMTKADIRRYSEALGLPTWNKPSSPCLSSRFPYGTSIDLERLRQVGRCEMVLKELHFREFRVRYHGDLARIEVHLEEMARFSDPEIRASVVRQFKATGFKHISLDLQGFRSGSLNETIAKAS